MRKQFRHLAVATCITAAAAFGSHIAAAETSSPKEQSAVSEGQQLKRKGKMRQDHLQKMAKELGLTEQQKSQAMELYKNKRAANKATFDDMRSAKRQLRALVHSGSADEAAIRAQAAKVADLQADLAVKKAQGVKQFLAILTPEQVTKFQAMQGKWKGKSHRFNCCDGEMAK